MSEDLLYEEIYQKTQNCGRAQFVKLLQQGQIKIEQLQQENKELKKELENKRVCYYNNKAYDIKILINKNNILTEFEKWLEERINSPKLSLIEIITFKRCLEELQELKEGKK